MSSTSDSLKQRLKASEKTVVGCRVRLVFTSDRVGVGVSRKRPYDLVKIENRSRKWSHRLFGKTPVGRQL